MKNYELIIGLEVHIEQNTASKMFCECPAEHFKASPNSQTCPVCLGLPGALPFINSRAIENIIKFGLAFDSKIAEFSKFDRKHYRYPDLPKGYQISQFDLPLCFDGQWQDIGITRIHMEEDTGKLVHKNGKSLVDFNRSGVPLMELVTEPDFRDVKSVLDFLRETQLIVRYLNISTADMEKGSMRLEANISMRKIGETKLPDYKIELKNINSFKFLEKALKQEIKRQSKLLENGETPIQETRGYDEKSGSTFSQRTKEESADYRYFPEPDLPPLEISKSDLETIKKTMPKLPNEKREELKQLNLSSEYVNILISDINKLKYFEKAFELGKVKNISAKLLAGVIINQHLDKKYSEPVLLIKYLLEIQNKEYASGDKVDNAVNDVIKNNPKTVEEYKNGKTQIIGFLIGQVQKELKGKGDIKKVKEKLEEELEK